MHVAGALLFFLVGFLALFIATGRGENSLLPGATR